MRECNSTGGKLQLRILAPSLANVPSTLTNAWVDPALHAKQICAIQGLRGTVYREYDPIANQLLPDGRHYLQTDLQSWHILLQDTCEQQAAGCVRYRPIQGGYEELSVNQSALARSHRYGPLLRTAIERDIAATSNAGMHYAEVGLWALRPEARCSSAAVNLALTAFILAEHLDGGMGITTATTRHHSASILRRLGGRRLAELPAYYEPRYGCVIEVLSFALADLDSRFAARVNQLRTEIRDVAVICAAPWEQAFALDRGAYIDDPSSPEHIQLKSPDRQYACLERR
jgi:hypothetical protein